MEFDFTICSNNELVRAGSFRYRVAETVAVVRACFDEETSFLQLRINLNVGKVDSQLTHSAINFAMLMLTEKSEGAVVRSMLIECDDGDPKWA